MNIQGISGQRPVDSNRGGSGKEVQALEQQKKSLKEKLEGVKNDKNLNPETKKTKIESLEKEIKEVEAKIQEVKQIESGKVDEKKDREEVKKEKVEDSQLNPKDIYEKGDSKDQWDNSYSIVKGEDGLKIKFKRPKEEKDILLP